MEFFSTLLCTSLLWQKLALDIQKKKKKENIVKVLGVKACDNNSSIRIKKRVL